MLTRQGISDRCLLGENASGGDGQRGREAPRLPAPSHSEYHEFGHLTPRWSAQFVKGLRILLEARMSAEVRTSARRWPHRISTRTTHMMHPGLSILRALPARTRWVLIIGSVMGINYWVGADR